MRIASSTRRAVSDLLMSLLAVVLVASRLTVVNSFQGCLLSSRFAVLVSTSNLYAKKAGSFNPFSSLIGDLASSIMNGNTVEAKPAVDDALMAMKTSSRTWDDIRSHLRTQQTEEERQFRDNLPQGYGKLGSPLHKVRLYDESNSEKDVRVTFYRDSASWCPYCQKVWMTLEEKKIPYRVEKINMRCYGDKPASFLRLQPGGQIPVAIIDGKTYGQSNDIIYALEEDFPQHKSMRQPAGEEMRAQELLRLERKIFSAWMYWLTERGGDAVRFRSTFIEALNEIERALVLSGPFFLGPDVCLVDCMFAPFLERMSASLLYYKGFQMRVPAGTPTDYPALNRWFDAMETLPSYQLTKSDYYTHCWDLPPQLGGCSSEPGGRAYERAINGERSIDGKRGSWELPLQPHNDGVEPDWEWAGDEDAAKREAVERVSANYEAIVRFATRGAGRRGVPPVMAPLSDPNASPNEVVVGAVDECLRVVCMALLEGTETHDSDIMEIAQVVVKDGGQEFANGVVDSLAYLRDRVGVPRDMKLPAARQLRAHLNWSIGKLLEAL